jgi:hypothetical protein
VLPYALAQTAGAFVAALLVRWNYSEAISALDPEHTFATQGIFSTLPAEGLGTWGAFRDQIIGTAILMFLILVLTDARNSPPLANLAPFLIGIVVVVIGFAWGANAGYAINPARDFGPRLALRRHPRAAGRPRGGAGLASGTSSHSSKLVHGGLRYLEMLDFGLVREALRERGLLLQRLAPHLVRPVSFLYPLRHKVWERPYVGAGIFLYDAMAATSGNAGGLPRHRHLTRRGARRLAPDLRPDALVGAIRYSDAQVDDARHTMEVVRTAATYGAHVANRASVVAFLREGERVVGARVRDEDTSLEIDVRARQVINATGVWTDETQEMVGQRGRLRVRSSKGVHLVVPKDRISSTTGLILRTATSVLFVIPWGRHWIVGTTDTDWALDKAHPAATAADIDYLLAQVNEVLLTPLTRDDVEGVYAGLRPLLSGESDSTSKLSREHTVASPAPGLVVVEAASTRPTA